MKGKTEIWRKRVIKILPYSNLTEQQVLRIYEEIVKKPAFSSWDSRAAYHSRKRINHPLFGNGLLLRIKGGISNETRWREKIEKKQTTKDFSSIYETGLPGFYSKHMASYYVKVARKLVDSGLDDLMINIPLAVIEFPNIRALRFWKPGKKRGITTSSTSVLELSKGMERFQIIERALEYDKEARKILEKKLKEMGFNLEDQSELEKGIRLVISRTRERLARNLERIWEETGYVPDPKEWGFHDFDFQGRVADYDGFKKVFSRRKAKKTIEKILSRFDLLEEKLERFIKRRI